MADQVSTDALLRRLFRTKNLNNFMKRNESNLRCMDFCAMLRAFCEAREMVPERVILAAQIDRTYGHQLFNGTRRPSRDKTIQIALALGLSVEETQKLLQAAGKSALYPRLKRDAVLIFCLKNGCDLIQTQNTLEKNRLTLLGDAG